MFTEFFDKNQNDIVSVTTESGFYNLTEPEDFVKRVNNFIT